MNNDTLILQSKPYTDKVIGFAGPTPLEIILDASGKISEVKLLPNKDTPKYVQIAMERTYAPGSTGKESRCSIRSYFYIKGDY